MIGCSIEARSFVLEALLLLSVNRILCRCYLPFSNSLNDVEISILVSNRTCFDSWWVWKLSWTKGQDVIIRYWVLILELFSKIAPVLNHLYKVKALIVFFFWTVKTCSKNTCACLPTLIFSLKKWHKTRTSGILNQWSCALSYNMYMLQIQGGNFFYGLKLVFYLWFVINYSYF